MKISLADDKSGITEASQVKIYSQRRERLREKLSVKGIDALVVSSAPNRFYLSGFELHDSQPGESSGILVICANGEDWLLTDSRYDLAAKKLWPAERIMIYKRQGEALAKILGACANLVGVEFNSLSWDYVSKLKALLGQRVFLQPADGLVESLREIKDTSEIEALRQSFRLNHQMFDWLDQEFLKTLSPNMREEKLAWEIERLFRERGAQELAFSTIVAGGRKSAEPHAIPDQNEIKKNEVLLVDAGCRVNNYCSDQTRTWWLGEKPSPEFVSCMGLVREAQQAAMDIMRPGVECKSVYAAARKVFEKAGVADFFTHGLGHGVGLETHEAPRLSQSSNDVLAEGMTVTVEPGLYYPEWGGIRWEYTVLVNNKGVEIL